MKKYLAAFVLLVVLLPTFAGAAGGLSRIQTIAGRILDWMYTFALALGVMAIIWGAIRYITAGGDSKQVEEAKKMIIYVVVGLAVAILAKGVPDIIKSVIE